MNPSLRDIVKQELQKLLDVNFIYPYLTVNGYHLSLLSQIKMENGGSAWTIKN
jgi:hypothetical protein